LTEVPEHLLRRSRERREALGLLPTSGDAPSDAATQAEAPGAEGTGTPAAPAPVAPQTTPEAAPPPAPAPAAEEAPALPPALVAATRTRVPAWVVPVLVALPFWGVLYVGAFGSREVQRVVTPQEVYARAGCSACHGAQGEGGTGPALAGAASRLTFPNEEDHVNWVKNGSASVSGQKYGDPARPGGQRGPASGGMPAFSGQLSDAEIRMVVQYEREQL
jgi:mono/diheme cytochrome c family protein